MRIEPATLVLPCSFMSNSLENKEHSTSEVEHHQHLQHPLTSATSRNSESDSHQKGIVESLMCLGLRMATWQKTHGHPGILAVSGPFPRLAGSWSCAFRSQDVVGTGSGSQPGPADVAPHFQGNTTPFSGLCICCICGYNIYTMIRLH